MWEGEACYDFIDGGCERRLALYTFVADCFYFNISPEAKRQPS